MKLPDMGRYPNLFFVRDQKLNKHNWRLKFEKSFDNKYQSPGKTLLGLCHYPDRDVEILRTRSRRQLARIFIHEFLHAIEFERGIKIPHSIIEHLEEGIFYFIVDNFLKNRR